jgi:hypothetical protein
MALDMNSQTYLGSGNEPELVHQPDHRRNGYATARPKKTKKKKKKKCYSCPSKRIPRKSLLHAFEEFSSILVVAQVGMYWYVIRFSIVLSSRLVLTVVD